MSAMAKKGREALKAKARKMASAGDQKVDSSNWTPPPALKADVKTGMRPVSRRAYKTGGKVMGEDEACRMDRKPRATGGKTEAKEIAVAKTNRNVKDANEEREGEKHVGGMKKGGRAKRESGGMAPPETGEARAPAKNAIDQRARGASDAKAGRMVQDAAKMVGAPGTKPVGLDKDQVERMERGYKKGGRTKKMDGGSIPHDTKAGTPVIPGMKKGGRTERKSGGRVGKTNINIVIATKPQGGPDGTVNAPMAMRPPGGIPVPVPPPGGAGGPPPGMPMPMPMGGPPPGPPPGMPPMARKRGGRVFQSYKDMKAGAASGEGRLEKTEIQKHKR